MEVKKSDKANIQKSSMLYFLIGLNIVLFVVLMLFNYKQYDAPPMQEEEVAAVEAPTEAVLVDIPLPKTPPPPPPPTDEAPPPPPPPQVIPTKIEETPKPVPPPPLKDQDKLTPPEIPTSSASTASVSKVDLTSLKSGINNTPKKEERATEPVTVNRVAEMAVYPGCEKYKGDKRQLIKCFGDQLENDILRYLNTEFPDVNKESVGVRLEFHVDKNGYITNIDPKYGDEVFKPEAKRALEKTAEYLRRKGKIIQPAKMADGSTAVLIFTRDVRLKNPNY